MPEELDFQRILEKYAPDKHLEKANPDLASEQTKADKELVAVTTELIDKVRPIVEARNKIKKEQDDLVFMLSRVIVKLDEVIGLKNVNAEKEREVLDLLKKELLGGV